MIIFNRNTHVEHLLTDLTKENRRYQWIHIALVGTGMILSLTFWNILPFVIGLIVSRLSIHAYWKEAKEEATHISAKVNRERTTLRVLSSLTDEWYVVNDRAVSASDVTQHLHHIVMGPHGVFVVETKNGEINRHSLKTTEKKRQALALFLKEHKLQIDVKGCVYIPDLNAEIAFYEDTIPAFSQPETLIRYINNFPHSANLSKETIQAILQAVTAR